MPPRLAPTAMARQLVRVLPLQHPDDHSLKQGFP